ncbi:hypothetical protein [Reticulibacter mediterranei]|uniref:hypothetical protein n=1 Tax=Reticulibacter mediterranei TaxID=2778369 RepID=UPI001C68AE89|nr:hypothetical protein [Reticulibacter mediterranei]
MQPSQTALERSLPEQPLYEQGYQEQAPGHTNNMLKEDRPQAQYPEQLPPMS